MLHYTAPLKGRCPQSLAGSALCFYLPSSVSLFIFDTLLFFKLPRKCHTSQMHR